MGLTAEKVARREGVTRDDQDAWALRSHARAAAAEAGGRFHDEIVPVATRQTRVTAGRPTVVTGRFEADEGIRLDTDAAALGKLKPVFDPTGTVTAGNSSQTSDGAAALVVMTGERAAALGLRPLGRFVVFATAGVAPELFGIGPVPAVPKVLAKAGLTLDRDRPGRAERGIRRAGRSRSSGELAIDRTRAQRQRRRDRARPPARLHRREADDSSCTSWAAARPATAW